MIPFKSNSSGRLSPRISRLTFIESPDAENIKIAYIIDVQIIVRDMKCVGDILGTEFCWPKEKKIKYKIAFYPISEVMFPKDMKDKCNPRKRSIIGV